MTDVDFNAVEHRLRLISSDLALMNAFKAQHPTLVVLLSDMFAHVEPSAHFSRAACPPEEDIAALQCTIFDNWKQVNRGNRWGAAVKAYTSAPVKNWKKPAWAANVALWPIEKALKKAQALQSHKLKNPISDATVELVRQVVDSDGADLVGILCHKHPADGTFFYEQHIIGIVMGGAVVTGGFIYTPNCSIGLPPFVATDAAGDALSGRAVAMSRYSDLDTMADWTTSSTSGTCIK